LARCSLVRGRPRLDFITVVGVVVVDSGGGGVATLVVDSGGGGVATVVVDSGGGGVATVVVVDSGGGAIIVVVKIDGSRSGRSSKVNGVDGSK